MTKKIISIFGFLLLISNLTGCGSTFNVSTVHAAGTPNSVFSGRYIFQSHGQFSDGAVFNEGGTIEADGQGGFVLNSTMNVNPGTTQTAAVFHPANIQGNYNLDSTLKGTAGQPQTGDKESLFCSADGSRCTMVSEIQGFTWLATLERD
jgi:hypothetical protein